jgi:hypothetical protein
MKIHSSLIVALLSPVLLFGQLTGTITDASGEPLPFASVYIANTSIGTTSNIEGFYELPLEPGTYELVFQYVGYRSEVRSVTMTQKPKSLDVTLNEETISLEEIVVRANAEDPAYPIIRKAIEKRKYYRDLVGKYACDVYVKGNIKVLDAPDAIMGVEIGDMGGALDSTRQGIIYLSESEAKYYYQAPNDKKEVMLSTKVSGNDNGFGFNRASEMDFNLYENHALLGRQIISPIASNALLYYRYQLLGAFPDERGRMINKIKVIPKRSEDPVYSGVINIVDDLWNIQTVDLTLSSSNIKQPGLDTLYIKQVHVPVQAPDVWRMFSQTIRFQAGLFGFEMEGNFQAIFSNYDLAPTFERGFFNNEIFKVTEGANDRGLEYWDTIRPIPLTQEESIDYVRKDSLQEIRTSKVYLDSVDAKNNRFKVWDLLFGYNYNNSYGKSSFSVNSPLTTIQYNTVQGWNTDLRLRYSKAFDKYSTRRMLWRANVNYGFADQQMRVSGGFSYYFNRTKFTRLRIDGGRQVAQFNDQNPITPTLNTIYSLVGRENYMKIYDRAFFKADIRHELFNGVLLQAGASYNLRSPLVNRTNYSIWGDKAQDFDSNDPRFPDNYEPSFLRNSAVIFNAALRLRYKQQYITYPERKFVQGSPLPSLWILYRKGLSGIANSKVNFDHLAFRLEEDYLALGVLGYLDFNIEAGAFLNKSRLTFIDFKHFNGNQTFIANPARYRTSFFLLPYYEHSTNGRYLEAHLQHHFEGFLLDKIPGINKLGWTTVLGGKFLYTEEQEEYAEMHFGIDRIGFGPVRLFRFDVVTGYSAKRGWNWGFMLGMRLPSN